MKPFASTPSSTRISRLPRMLASAAGLCAAFCLLLPGPARADDQGKETKQSKPAAAPKKAKSAAKEKAKPTSADKAKEEKVLITGSLIPQRVSRRSGTLNTASHVYVIDSEQILRSGASSVAGVLNRYGINR